MQREAFRRRARSGRSAGRASRLALELGCRRAPGKRAVSERRVMAVSGLLLWGWSAVECGVVPYVLLRW